MSMLSAEFIAELRSRVSLVSIVGQQTNVQRAGRQWKACCPLHGERTPSFTIYEDGHYHCFGCGAHGDTIRFVSKTSGLGFRQAAELLADQVGLELPNGARPDPELRRKVEARRAQHEAAQRRKQEREQRQRHAWAQSIAAEACEAEHLVADLYLGIDRCIPHNAAYPMAIGYHPGRNALIAIATDADGQVTGGQFVHLDQQGHKLSHTEAVARGYRAAKETFGSLRCAAVRLPPRDDRWRYDGDIPIACIAESVEAGCSIWQVSGLQTEIVLGVSNFRHAFRRDRCNVACLDDDARGSAAWRQAQRAIRRARADGCLVLIVHTSEIRLGDKADLNDILRQSGPEGPELLLQRIRATVQPDQPCKLRVSPEEGIRQVRRALEAFMAAAVRFATLGDEQKEQSTDAPQIAIRGDTGLSKSTIGRELLAEATRQVRKAGIAGPAVIFVPRLDLAEEAAEALRAIAPDLTVGVWRGRSQPGMCDDLDRIHTARARMLDPQKHACSSCPLADTCAYQRQREQQADVWFAAHQMLYEPPPRALSKAWLTWTDETAISAALIGTSSNDEEAPTLPLEALRRHDRIPNKLDAADRLLELRGLAYAVLETLPPGALTAAPFRRAGLTGDLCREARKLEFATKIEPELGDPLEAADLNLDLAARARFWLSLTELFDLRQEIASGHLRIATNRDGHTVIRMRGRRKVHKAWQAMPALLTDASLQMELVRHVWPRMKLGADIPVKAPHQHTRQIIDRSYSLSQLDAADPKLLDDAKLPPKLRHSHKLERARRLRNLRAVHALLHREARLTAPGTLLAVAQQRIVEQLEHVGPLPRNVELLHHGAVTGLDRYRNVPRIMIIGRQAPAPAAVEACAEALTGFACTRLPAGQWYQRRDAVHELNGDKLVPAERDCHPDAIAEAFRQRITIGELLQIIGRGRGLWRTADNPLHVLVLTDEPLGIPVDELTIDAAEQPSFEDQQIAAGGLAFQCATDAAKAYPEMWRRPERAQYASRRYGRGQPARTVAWRYQVAGQGHAPQLVYALPEMTADTVRSHLAQFLGPLALFERAETQRTACTRYDRKNIPSDCMNLSAEQRPEPFVWRAFMPWRFDHPPVNFGLEER
jgi:CHC2-type zinc finger protein